jgi:hypothetical protein
VLEGTKGERGTLPIVPPANNARAHRLALKNGWYSRFAPDLNVSVSCEASEPGAGIDIIRGLEVLRLKRDPGPRTPETVLAARGITAQGK